jgi:hypothetical protein
MLPEWNFKRLYISSLGSFLSKNFFAFAEHNVVIVIQETVQNLGCGVMGRK